MNGSDEEWMVGNADSMSHVDEVRRDAVMMKRLLQPVKYLLRLVSPLCAPVNRLIAERVNKRKFWYPTKDLVLTHDEENKHEDTLTMSSSGQDGHDVRTMHSQSEEVGDIHCNPTYSKRTTILLSVVARARN